MFESILNYLPVAVALVAAALFLTLMNWVLLGRHKNIGTQARLPRQLSLLVLTMASLLILIILFPMSDLTRGQIITLIGVVITGVIALSSTSFVANVMAGLMLHVVKSFHPGDFIKIGPLMGRVTERGLFHTEIQTEDRNLTTIPNLHLATSPVTVVHGTGTIISAELSLGYDLSHEYIGKLLKAAAIRAELEDPFVLVLSLNDYSVSYRISAFLAEVKNLISASSDLKKSVLDVLHENNVEIVSPAFMNQRQLEAGTKIIADKKRVSAQNQESENQTPEDLIFSKAETAGEAEDIRREIEQCNKKIEKLLQLRKDVSKYERHEYDLQIKTLEGRISMLKQQLEVKMNPDEQES